MLGIRQQSNRPDIQKHRKVQRFDWRGYWGI